MGKLIGSQIIYLWHYIKKRYFIWMGIWIIGLVVINFQVQNYPVNLLHEVFDGISFSEIQNHVLRLPVMWLVCFFCPELIFLNSINEVQIKRGVIFRGMQFSPLQLVIGNIVGIIFFSVTYSMINMGIIFLLIKKVTSDLLKIGILIFLGVTLLLILQAIIGVYSNVLGVIVPLILLIGTAYLKISWNPLNYLMLTRKESIRIILYVVIIEIIIFIVYSVKGKLND